VLTMFVSLLCNLKSSVIRGGVEGQFMARRRAMSIEKGCACPVDAFCEEIGGGGGIRLRLGLGRDKIGFDPASPEAPP